MTGSLFSALSGLKANQSWIDVIGNNLANVNTPGFKSSGATFADHFSRNIQFASAPSANQGGRNPIQIGQGVRLADTPRNFAQGSLTSTGRAFDIALQGNGFFAVSNGIANLYTRVGSFGLDALSNLVDVRTGYRVLDPAGQPIAVDTTSLLAPRATSSAKIAGNLPKEVTGPLREQLASNAVFAHGFPAEVTGTATGPFAIPTGQTWSLQVTVGGGTTQTASVTSTTGTVGAAQVANAIDALDDVSATVDGSGRVVVTTDRTGEDVTLKIGAGPSGADLAGAAGLSTTLVSGSESPITPSTTLNDLPGNVVDYVAGDRIRISGVDFDGTPISAEFVYGAANDGETIDDFVAFVDALYAGATASVDASGKLMLESDATGETGLQLAIADDAAAAGETQWAVYAMSTETQGTPADQVSTAMEVYDQAGVAHVLTLDFARQEDGTWTLTPQLEATDGTVLSAPITGIEFADDGTPIGFGGLDATVTLGFTGQLAAQDVELDLGADGALDGLTQLGASGEVIVREQDGYGTGELSSLSVDVDGAIVGLYTNGQSQELGAVGVATFTNPDGLEHVGENFFRQSLNSGTPSLGEGISGSAGRVIGGSLENSNVDTAEQFVRLIEAQRGFQANARVITATNEVLRDMVNLI